MPKGVYPHKPKHGHSHSPTYSSWRMMMSRCKYPSHISYKNYGARGIRVCEAWQTFQGFLADLGERPSLAHSLDRINSSGNYEPGNVRWATLVEQRRNMQQNVMVTIDGRTLCATDWANEHGLRPSTVLARIKLGWDPVVAVTEPASHRRALYRGGQRIGA